MPEGNGQQRVPDAPMSGSNTPAATPSGTPAPATPNSLSGSARPSPAGRGRGGAKPQPKFAGRRSATARAELEAAAAKKKEAEAKAAAEEAKRKAKDDKKFGYGRGRGGARGGGRGRGGHIGDRPREYSSEASGVFGSGQTTADIRSIRSGRPGGIGTSGGGGMSGRSGGVSGMRSGGPISLGGAAIKREFGDVEMGGLRTMIKTEDGGYISSDEDENEGDKRDVDRMQVIDLTGEQTPDIEDPFVPVRLSRVPHQERAVGLQAEESPETSDAAEVVSEKRRGKQKASDVEVTGTAAVHKRPTTYSSSDTEGEPQIKQEPEDDQQGRPVTPDLAALQPGVGSPGADQSSSPERRRKAKEKIKETADAVEDGNESDIERPPEPHFQTQAEKDEWSRFYEDKQKVRHELGRLLPRDAAPPDVDGDIAMIEETAHLKRARVRQIEREKHVYLFQFPPVLPDLKAVTIKSDPDAAGANGNKVALAMDIDGGGAGARASRATDSTGSTRPTLPSGQVGKLRVHKSGKTTLDWGGTSMVLNLGADATFLQNVLIAKVPETKPQDGDKPPEDLDEANAMGMGLIRAKFVLTPDWDEILK